MARTRKKPEEKKTYTKAKWTGFVNVYLSPEEKKQIKKELFTFEGCLLFLQEAGEAGYKVSLSYSQADGVWTVTLTGQYRELPNAGLSMSMRHKDVEVAITALWWCYHQAGAKGSWEERYTVASQDDW